MKRLVISGLLSLAAVSCGSSKTTAEDVVSAYCGGAAVAKSATKFTSCHGAYWTKTTAGTAAEVADSVCKADALAYATTEIGTETDDAKKATKYKELKDAVNFDDATKAAATCLKLTYTVTAP